MVGREIGSVGKDHHIHVQHTYNSGNINYFISMLGWAYRGPKE